MEFQLLFANKGDGEPVRYCAIVPKEKLSVQSKEAATLLVKSALMQQRIGRAAVSRVDYLEDYSTGNSFWVVQGTIQD